MSSAGGQVINEIVATNAPREVVNPRGKSHFALDDGLAGDYPSYARRTSVDVEAVRTNSAINREAYPVPTEEELGSLRKVAGTIPTVAWLLCLVEFAERASYYGAKGPFNNFLQLPLPKGGNGAGAPPSNTQLNGGALGKGVQFASALGMMFSLMSYFFPVLGAFLADAKLGRWKTIWLGVIIGGIAHVIMICGAIPSVLQSGHGVAPFVISLVVLAIGAGLFKPNVVPTVIDQYQHQTLYTKVLKSGEKVIVDPETTIQRIMLFFYMFVNIGGFYGVATTYSEKYVGFWLAFLTPGIIYFLLPLVLLFLTNRIIRMPPDGSALIKFTKIVKSAINTNKFAFWRKDFWGRIMPSQSQKSVSWSDIDVTDVKRTISACAIFLYLPIYNLNDTILGSLATTLPGMMTTNGAPNDVINNINSLAIIIFVPILSYGIYPLLQKFNLKFGRINRITLGMVLAALANVIGAIIQWNVYESHPCGYYGSTGTCDKGTGVSPLNVWITAPIFILTGMSECFVNVTCYELAYARSPPAMRSVVMSIFLLMNCVPYILGEILTPITQDPYLVWNWAGPAIFLFAQTIIFWFRYNKYNHDDFMTPFNAIDSLVDAKHLDAESEDNVPHTVDKHKD